jgi:uroporphyrinogen decarboxylase
MALFDQPDLVRAMTDRIGTSLVRHYERCLESDNVGAAISNDDWGFQQQPLLSPSDVREYILPWHTKIVKTIHDAGRPAIMHSCGNVYDCGLIEDVIEICKFDARHSYEDKILPVEEAYERYHQRIAILGGIDVDFLCRKTPEEIYRRSKEMLERTAQRGGYALGSGNSIADYVPHENYFAMISAATGMKY